MMTGKTVFRKTYPAPPTDTVEILRYMGTHGKNADENLLKTVENCLAETEKVINYTACYAKVDIEISGNKIVFPFSSVVSESLSSHLSDCRSAVIFAATLGIGIDRLIMRYGTASPLSALAVQAIGTERIEALCDEICRDGDVTGGKATRSRFSPGYGDLPLSFQTEIFSFLECGKNIGVTLNESLTMSPTKSVTAIIGIE